MILPFFGFWEILKLSLEKAGVGVATVQPPRPLSSLGRRPPARLLVLSHVRTHAWVPHCCISTYVYLNLALDLESLPEGLPEQLRSFCSSRKRSKIFKNA